MKLKEFTPALTKKAVQGAETGARAMVGMHNKLDAKMANTPSIAKTQQYKDYKKGNQQRKIAAMKQGMPYGRQDGPGTGANAVQGGALKPITGLRELKIRKPDSADTKGIKRVKMPQIHKKDYNEFIDYLKDNGADFTKQTMPAKQLKATQGEFSDAGVEKQLMKYIKGEPKKPVIASNDNFIIDGHHRWIVAWNTGDTLEVFKVNIDADELLKLVRNFPKTTYKDIYTEELYDFDKDQPMKSIVAVPGYGTMSIDGLMKNVIDQTTAMLKQMQQGTQGFRNADYELNRNKVLPSKIAALIQALDDLQAIRKKGGSNSRNIEKESVAEQEQEELPIDIDGIFKYIQRLESQQNIQPQDADLMRRGIQSLTAKRQTINPQAILQLLSLLT